MTDPMDMPDEIYAHDSIGQRIAGGWRLRPLYMIPGTKYVSDTRYQVLKAENEELKGTLLYQKLTEEVAKNIALEMENDEMAAVSQALLQMLKDSNFKFMSSEQTFIDDVASLLEKRKK